MKIILNSNLDSIKEVFEMSGKIEIEGENLVFEIHGVDEFLALKKRIEIPLQYVSSVSTDKVNWINMSEMRVAGANLPGVVKDGRFHSSDGWIFYEVHDPDKCVTIELNHAKYKRIVFQVEDKEEAAELIRNAAGK